MRGQGWGGGNFVIYFSFPLTPKSEEGVGRGGIGKGRVGKGRGGEEM